MVSSAWLAPRACSVIGAAHRRQGKPCQDASLTAQLTGQGGQTLQLLAVADGHGSSRSWLSDRGSALACREAERAVAEVLAVTPLEDTTAWETWLASGLAAAVQRRWREAIAADWKQRKPNPPGPLEPVTYGCTLGLVLLAPRWWGCTGLGDWDLVAVTEKGSASLVSEEPSLGPQASGEATASLCLPEGPALWGPRAQLHPLAAQPQLRALVLSTDGVRKSCASDADFLALCGQVIALRSPQELEEGLAQITRQGSGDDVSLAMALRQRPPSRRWPLAAALLLAGATTLAVVGLVRRPTAPPADPVLVQQRALCADPSRIRANLTPRRAQLQQLRRDPSLAAQLLAAPQNDPLGALLARSQRGSLNPCPALEQQLMALWRDAGGKMPAAAQRSNERPPAGDRPAAPGSR
ncbi:MAG: protein phosphatase 2C domain-containing protein [Cyanobacteria bacterium M_DeepCast_200m_mx_001]|nr:protein phosphatase 2C domain-containing protein [Cyanobacteria bacterium M_DeepCast_200m_mx_001]